MGFLGVGYGIVSIAVTNLLYIKSISLVSPEIAIISVFTAAPLTTLTVKSLIGKSRPQWLKVCLVFACIMGCFLTCFGGVRRNQHWLGVVFGLGAGFTYGLYSIFGKKLTGEYQSLTRMFWQFGFATVATLIFYVITLSSGQTPGIIQVITFKVMLGIAGIGVFSTFLPYYLYNRGLTKGVEETVASAMTVFEPITVAIAAFLLYGRLSWHQAAGICLVVGALVRLALIHDKEVDRPEPEGVELEMLAAAVN